MPCGTTLWAKAGLGGATRGSAPESLQHIRICTYIYIYVHTYIYIKVYMYRYIYISIYTSVYMYIYRYVLHTDIYIYINM